MNVKQRVGVICIIVLQVGLLSLWTVSHNLRAQQLGQPEGRSIDVVAAPERGAIAVMTAKTSTGDGTAYDIGFRARQACTITLGGTSPTSVTITGKRSTDTGTTYASIFTHTYTVATPSTQAFDVEYLGRYWKFSFDSKVGGDGTTAVTIKCDAKE